MVVLQEELSVGESAVLKFIDYDGNIAQRSLDESSIHLSEVRPMNRTHTCSHHTCLAELKSKSLRQFYSTDIFVLFLVLFFSVLPVRPGNWWSLQRQRTLKRLSVT